ncbi:MAG: YkvA family protein [Cyclobacteriaceae bacterium]
MSERRVYHRILDRAKEMVNDNDRLRNLVINAGERLSKIGDDSEEGKGFLKHVKLLIRMIRAHVSGAYRAFSTMTLVLFVFALLYFITPLDLIPDIIPALGFTDDIAVALMVFKRCSADIQKYRKWEEAELSQ